MPDKTPSYKEGRAPHSYWLGAQRHHYGDKFRWVGERSEIMYNAWQESEEDQRIPSFRDSCVEMGNGSWNNAPCHKPNRFICQRGASECYMDRLKHFSLTAQSESGQETYRYSDQHLTAEPRYSVVHRPKLDFPVRSVRIDVGNGGQILTLCEVQVLGETACPAGHFGLGCAHRCNCADRTERCFVHSGGCPSGCATGFTGEDCMDCEAGWYGTNCEHACSVTCGGDRSCDQNDGTCRDGCFPGYFGASCSEHCSPTCVGDRSCDQRDGTCLKGCVSGYIGPLCKTPCRSTCAGDNSCDQSDGTCHQECVAGYTGANCREHCSVTCGGDRLCAQSDGTCLKGCVPGYFGRLCNETCSATCVRDRSCDQIDGTCNQGCVAGYTGANCREHCSSSCGGDRLCAQSDGTCLKGCFSGYTGLLCKALCSSACGGDNSCNQIDGTCHQGCDAGYAGANCSERCSDTCGGDRSCDQSDGTCHQGCVPGYFGPLCKEICSVTCGEDNSCGQSDGSCSQMKDCGPGEQGSECESTRTVRSEGSEKRPTWAVVSGLLICSVVVASVIIVVLACRLRKLSRQGNTLPVPIGLTTRLTPGSSNEDTERVSSYCEPINAGFVGYENMYENCERPPNYQDYVRLCDSGGVYQNGVSIGAARQSDVCLIPGSPSGTGEAWIRLITLVPPPILTCSTKHKILWLPYTLNIIVPDSAYERKMTEQQRWFLHGIPVYLRTPLSGNAYNYCDTCALRITTTIGCSTSVSASTMASGGEEWKKAKSIYEFSALDIDGNNLQALHAKYAEKGLAILGFPCNQFGSQEPGTNEEIKKFAQDGFGVQFDMFAKIEVNGKNAHPLFKYLKKQQGGTLGDFIKWNFSKFLVDKEGKPVNRYAPNVEPNAIEKDFTKLL
ncbi:hypothetical protein EGW08_013276 [Elysia chlorotica]|uniref:Glutathione peroxidase n=1 Tax=Elysia chlorotica TaxID=188477 RepID=A0A3S1HGM1_ELYCH|nr:hypothetical protein EGW08_013276 [Elysia chlorotica]